MSFKAEEGTWRRIHVDFDLFTETSLDTTAFSGDGSGEAHGNLVRSRVMEPSGFFTMLR